VSRSLAVGTPKAAASVNIGSSTWMSWPSPWGETGAETEGSSLADVVRAQYMCSAPAPIWPAWAPFWAGAAVGGDTEEVVKRCPTTKILPPAFER
jgi:hypothetical protein